MTILRYWMAWAFLLCLAGKLVLANDVIHLTSGEEIAGQIKSENDTQVLI